MHIHVLMHTNETSVIIMNTYMTEYMYIVFVCIIMITLYVLYRGIPGSSGNRSLPVSPDQVANNMKLLHI